MAKQRVRRQAWPFYLAVGIVLAALPVGYFVLLEREGPPPVEAAQELEKGPAELKLVEASGQVEVRHGGGEWLLAHGEEVLKASDAVRTDHGARAVLLGGEAYQVKMEPGTEVAVAELSESISRLLLETGMATARVNGQARHTFEVRASGSEAVASTHSGAFAISSNGAGTVAVGTSEGEVRFLGGEAVVIVRAGQQSMVRPGQGPSEPAPIPSSLLLKINLAAASTVKQRRLVLSGEVEPGCQVEVGGRVAKADEQGRFAAPIELREGENRLEVTARSVGGRSAVSAHVVTLDTRVNKLEIDKHLWDAPGVHLDRSERPP